MTHGLAKNADSDVPVFGGGTVDDRGAMARESTESSASIVPPQLNTGGPVKDGYAIAAWPEDSADIGYDPPETYNDYGDWQDDYADAVGIPRRGEL